MKHLKSGNMLLKVYQGERTVFPKVDQSGRREVMHIMYQSQEAIDLSTKLTLNNQIRLDYQPNYQTDRWKRLLAYVFINDTFLNEQLVRQGLCEVTIYQKRAKLKYQDELFNAQNQAKQEKLGKWQ